MKNIYHRLLLVIAGSTQKELASQIRYLKIENQTLRSKLPARVPVTEKERAKLVRFSSKLGKALGELVTIVHPDTLRRWIRESKKATKKKLAKKGRPRTKEEIRELIIKLARETGWGYTRIMGELKKLGITPPSRNTVKNILKANGLDPGPKRGEGTWDEFLKIHAATLWQCDFFSKKVLTSKGFRDLFVLVFLHVGTRRVFITPATYKPDEMWMLEQAKAFHRFAADNELEVTILMHDRDSKFSTPFDEAIGEHNIKVQKSAYRSPNTLAFVERFVQTVQQEVLDYFIVFGPQHMDYLCSQFAEHYHEERPHQGKENELLITPTLPKKGRRARDESQSEPVPQIKCRERLGGLLKHYYLNAA